jgi:TonB family protein
MLRIRCAAITIVLSFCLAGLANPVGSTQTQEPIYKPNQVSVRAKITRKVEPRYTEEARRYRTSGTVIVNMVLRASGEVTDIVVITGLPHGLNDSAVRAAQETKFEPALKDDRKVSQYVRVEYGFHTY